MPNGIKSITDNPCIKAAPFFGGVINMKDCCDKDLVSIIMLSHGDSTHIVETVKSILEQTYQNWELLFVAKTDDESLKPFSLLREEDIKIQNMAGKVLTDSYSNRRISDYILLQNWEDDKLRAKIEEFRAYR